VMSCSVEDHPDNDRDRVDDGENGDGLAQQAPNGIGRAHELGTGLAALDAFVLLVNAGQSRRPHPETAPPPNSRPRLRPVADVRLEPGRAWSI
jgi:hypothetical protein